MLLILYIKVTKVTVTKSWQQSPVIHQLWIANPSQCFSQEGPDIIHYHAVHYLWHMVELEPVTSGKCTTRPQEHTNVINEGPDAMVTAELMKGPTTTAYFLPLISPKKNIIQDFVWVSKQLQEERRTWSGQRRSSEPCTSSLSPVQPQEVVCMATPLPTYRVINCIPTLKLPWHTSTLADF